MHDRWMNKWTDLLIYYKDLSHVVTNIDEAKNLGEYWYFPFLFQRPVGWKVIYASIFRVPRQEKVNVPGEGLESGGRVYLHRKGSTILSKLSVTNWGHLILGRRTCTSKFTKIKINLIQRHKRNTPDSIIISKRQCSFSTPSICCLCW